jgi:hypothetical protein
VAELDLDPLARLDEVDVRRGQLEGDRERLVLGRPVRQVLVGEGDRLGPALDVGLVDRHLDPLEGGLGRAVGAEDRAAVVLEVDAREDPRRIAVELAGGGEGRRAVDVGGDVGEAQGRAVERRGAEEVGEGRVVRRLVEVDEVVLARRIAAVGQHVGRVAAAVVDRIHVDRTRRLDEPASVTVGV